MARILSPASWSLVVKAGLLGHTHLTIPTVSAQPDFSGSEKIAVFLPERDAVKVARISRESGCGIVIKDIEDRIQSCCFEPFTHAFVRRRNSHGAVAGLDQLID
jgi:hypothetical protein